MPSAPAPRDPSIVFGAEPRRILVVRLSALGDQILAAPVVDDIHRRWPGCLVDWAVDERFASVVRRNAGVERVHALPLKRAQRTGKLAGVRLLLSAAGALRRQPYDLVIDLQGLWKSALVSRMARVSPGGLRVGPVPSQCGEPAAARLYDRRIAVEIDRPDVPERSRALVAAVLGTNPATTPRYGMQGSRRPDPRAPVLLVHGASREGKRWPDEDWMTVGRALVAQGHRLALPWGDPQEKARSERIAAAVGAAHCEVAQERQTVEHWLERVAAAPLVVGVDTGFTHFAAALGTPVVALFMITPAWLLRPQAPALARALGGDGLPLPADRVVAAAMELLAASRA